jgi:hypothetical protein
MAKTGLVFYRFDHLWVVPAQGRTPGGLTLHIDPVMLVDQQDAAGLTHAIVERWETRPVTDTEDDSRSVMARALNLKTNRAFHERARAFYVERSPEELSIQEWRKTPRQAFTSPPLWKRTFGPDDLDELVWFLVKQDSVAMPESRHEEARRQSRSNGTRLRRN